MAPFTELQEPTLSAATKAQYLRRYQGFEKRFSRETGQKELTPDEVVANLILLKPTVTQRSWRTYKSAALYALHALYPGNTDAMSALQDESSAPLAKTSANTSGRKIKQVSETAWKALQVGIKKRIADGHRHAQGLLDVLTATLRTGLRPAEWCFASVEKHAASGREVLRVRNAKHTNGRANGEFRELFIDMLGPEDRKAIDAALLYCRSTTVEGSEQVITALRNELGIVRSSAVVASKKAQSNVTLYSFRHQFIADAKATLDDPVLISALVGHNSTKTAFEHYGKRRFGSAQIRVLPTPESVAAVQRVHLEVYVDFLEERSASRPFTL